MRLGITLAAWMAAVAVISMAAWALGADLRRICEAAVVALSPAVTGFILLGRFGESWARVYFVCAWSLSAAMLAASSGGASSPAAALLLAAPAFATAIGGGALVATATLVSAVLYAAAALAGAGIDGAPLGAAPEFYALGALLLVGAIFLRGARANANENDVEQRIAEVAHELRTPLSHMIGFAEMIESEMFGPAGARNREYAGLIRTSGQHLTDLIARRLDLARIAAGRHRLDMEIFDARAIAKDVARLSEGSAAAKKIDLALSLPEPDLIVRADAAALRQMLTNLVGNAIKFTPEGGRVRLSASASRDCAVFEVSDTGPGIAPNDRKRLTRPFERGASARDIEGAGLGLALVRALARLHGGDLHLSDAPDGGLLARLRLPVNGPQ